MPLPRALVLAGLTIMSFNLAYSIPPLSFLIIIYVLCLCELGRLQTGRQAFYLGLLTAVGCYAPQAGFMWIIFGPAAIALWFILAFWIALFLVLNRLCRIRFSKIVAALLIPVLWTSLEYFRSELYYLRFSWFNAGYVFSRHLEWMPIHLLGMYGVGFALMTCVALPSQLRPWPRAATTLVLLFVLCAIGFAASDSSNRNGRNRKSGNYVQVAGVQMEFPAEAEVVIALNRLVKEHPEAQLLVLSEYTFAGPVPDKIKKWCADNHRFLVIGAEDPVSGDQYYNTAFVIGPDGEFAFRQAKCVPIQFFKDGFPAREQKLWDSPWGKIGICICYDLSYTRVTDELVRLGANALIVPTMDIIDWGRHQHELHARVAPVRAAEYGLPIFRLASSGISQFVEPDGFVSATAPMPGSDSILFGSLPMNEIGSLPLDRYVAPLCVGITGLTAVWLLLCNFRKSGTIVPDPSTA